MIKIGRIALTLGPWLCFLNHLKFFTHSHRNLNGLQPIITRHDLIRDWFVNNPIVLIIKLTNVLEINDFLTVGIGKEF